MTTDDSVNDSTNDSVNDSRSALWANWTELETRIPLDDLPRFHRAFLTKVEPEEVWDEVFLRKIQGKVQASLKRLERQGLARQQNGDLYVVKDLIPAEFHHYLDAS